MRAKRILVAGLLLFPAAVYAQRPGGGSPPEPPKQASSPPPTPSPSPTPSHSEPPHPSSPPVSPAATHTEPSHAPVANSPSSPGRTHSEANHSPFSVFLPHTNREPKAPKTDTRASSGRADNDSRAAAPRGPKVGDPDMARNRCKREPCTTCPSGESLDKNGKCVAASVTKPAAAKQCPAGQIWNGAACVFTTQSNNCAAGEEWNGVSCDQTTQCATFQSRAQLIAAEARSAKAQMEHECRKNPSSKACQDLTQQHDTLLLRYQMLLNEAPTACRTAMPDPLSL
jgi:hypothetical protein